jgi:hypothetical protein
MGNILMLLAAICFALQFHLLRRRGTKA